MPAGYIWKIEGLGGDAVVAEGESDQREQAQKAAEQAAAKLSSPWHPLL